MAFTIYPAIDLRSGMVVRLQRGDPNQQTIFGTNPKETAARWTEAGANWIHVVNLDGAFDEGGAANWRALPDIVSAGVKIQFGGGLRSMKDVARAFSRGVARVVLGTIAVEDPDLVEDLVRRFGSDKIAVGIDTLHGRVRTHGWQSSSPLAPEILALQMRALGVSTIIFTDIERDGVLSGVNSETTSDLARATGMRVIASGGVSSLDDVKTIAAKSLQGVEGVIIGRALYDGRITLADALAIAGGQP